MSSCTSGSLFGPPQGYIKFLNGDAVAIDGGNVAERLILNDLRIPYKQIVKSRIILKAGQREYLLNYSGLGDNVTFLMLVARYDQKSKVEEDNYVTWNYFDDPLNYYYFAQSIMLTGNSKKRIPQIYLHNENPNYPVNIDVMVAVIDDVYTFFPDTNVSDLTIRFMNLCRIDNIIGSIVITDSDLVSPVVYINILTINSIERINNVLKIRKTTPGDIYLNFIDEYNAKQSLSLMNWLLEDTSRLVTDLGDCVSRQDNDPPIITFSSDVLLDNVVGSWTSLDSGVFSSTLTFSGIISKFDLINFLIIDVIDNRDGVLNLVNNNIKIIQGTDTLLENIIGPGSYKIFFNVSDIAENEVNPELFINLNVI